jgi:hypothetical protein
MNDSTDPIVFATVFRHEQAAILDRRRVQRIEALRQLGADGDYSRTARQWALDAASQEAMLAERAADCVANIGPLIQSLDRDQVTIQEVIDVFQTIRNQVFQPSDTSADVLPTGSDSPAGGRSSHARIQECAAFAVKALQSEPTPEQAAREAQDHLYRLLVLRESKPAEPGGTGAPVKGDMQGLTTALNNVHQARLKARELQKGVGLLSQPIATAAAFAVAAEAVDKAVATAALFEPDSLFSAAEVFASVAAATSAVVRAYDWVREPAPPAAPEIAIRNRLSENARLAVAHMTIILRAATQGCTDKFQDAPFGDLARQALRDLLEKVLRIAALTPEERQETLNDAESWSVRKLSRYTLDSLKSSVQNAVAPRPAAQPQASPDLLGKVRDLSLRCYADAFRLLPGEKARQYRNKGPDQPEPSSDEARAIATGAIKQLGNAAIEVAQWAWAAETQATQAIREATAILAWRYWPNSSGPTPPPAFGAGLAALGAGLPTPPRPPVPDLQQLRTQALDRGLVGLAFSGGGIRSATFGLGVLQALGHLRLLRFVDYFSTVSGGGYIGSWLAAWILREQSLSNVEKQLDPDRVQQAKADRPIKQKEDAPSESRRNPAYPLRSGTIDDEPEPVQHLRAYSRYLAPHFFSADTWTLGTIYVRNLVVNLASLAPWVFTLILLSRLLLWGFTLNAEFAGGGIKIAVAAVFLVCLAALWLWAYWQRARLREAFRDPCRHPDGADRIRSWHGAALLAAVVLTAAASLWLFSYSPPNDRAVERMSESELNTRVHIVTDSVALVDSPYDQDQQLRALTLHLGKTHFLALRHPYYQSLNEMSVIRDWATGLKFTLLCGALLFLLSVAGGLVRCLLHWQFRPELFGLLLLADLVMGLGLGFFSYLALLLVVWPAGTDAAAVAPFGVPALLTAVVLADYLEMLFIGSFLDESEREWRSRIAAYLVMIALGWLAFYSTTLYLPWAIQQYRQHNQMVVSLAAGAWAAISGFAAWAGRWLQSKSTSGWSIPWLRLVAAVGPPIFLLGLLAFAATLIFLLTSSDPGNYLNSACDSSVCAGSLLFRWLLLGGLGIVLVWNLIHVNVFSLHMLYANRLIRCYLGASRRKQNWNKRVGPQPVRNPQGGFWWPWGPGACGGPTNADVPESTTPPKRIARREPTFTDFDPADDLPLGELQPVAPKPANPVAALSADSGYRGPYPLVNTALNLVGSADLAIQDRRATSFVLTPDFCGSTSCGYAHTRGDTLTLGRAMTISGAAVDPNMGMYYYSPPVTALMTILNTRLGWWLQNPRWWGNDWQGTGPGAGPLLLWELLGQTNETSRYVHLSDGGHFENLGVYELIRRRCRYIIVADATEDRHAATENLANLMRLVRTDFGVGIQIDTEQLAEGPNGRTHWHCAIGLIHYEDVDPRAVAGVLVYLYPSMTGDEPPDLQQYQQANPAFPHDTTLEQFFSEAQFESYRGLGYHIGTEVFSAAALVMNRDCCDPETAQRQVREFFTAVRKRWFPPPPGAEQQFLPAANQYLGIARDLRAEVLQRLRQELYPEARDGSPRMPVLPLPPGSPTASAELHMVTEMLQVMEMVWYGMKLDSYHAHTLNRGWMNLFRRWTHSPTFHRHWPYARGEFSKEFVDFCEQALNMTATDVVAQQMHGKALLDWLPEVGELDIEFRQEWAAERSRLSWLTNGRYVMEAIAIANKFQPNRPLVWRLALRDDRGMVMNRCAGVACVGPPYLGAGRDLEFLLWLRGSYRTLGIGRSRLPDILDTIRKSSEAWPAGQMPYRLVTYYPDSGVNKADRLAKAQWMNFFFDHRFRSVPADDPGAVPGVITLGLELR